MLPKARRRRRIKRQRQQIRHGRLPQIFPVADSGQAQAAEALRAGQRHIEEPQLLGLAFPRGLLLGSWPRVHVRHQRIGAVLAFAVIEQGPGPPGRGGKVRTGQHDHIIFQPLGGMEGDNLHQPLVAFQMQLPLVPPTRLACRRLPLPGKPLDQPVHARRGGGAGLQELQQLPQIAQLPLAVRQPQPLAGQAPLPHQRHQHGAYVLLPPEVVIALEFGIDRLLRLHILVQRLQLGGVALQETAGQRRLQGGVPPGFQRRLQDELHRLCRVFQEDAVQGEMHALDAAPRKGLLGLLGVGTGAHQKGDAAGGKRLAAEGRLAFGGGGKQLGCPFRSRFHQGFPRLAQGGRLVGGEVGQQQLAGLGAGAANHQGRLGAVGGAGWAALDLPLGVKDLLAGKEVVDQLHHGVCGAPVDCEGMGGLRLAAGVQVGVDVRPAELVDGLLGVAHHQQRLVAGRRRHLVEDGGLYVVRVLEFVHHHHRPALGKPRRHAAALAFQSVAEASEQVVQGQGLLCRFEFLQAGAQRRQQPVPKVHLGLAIERLMLADLLDERQRFVLQGRRIFFAGGVQAGGAIDLPEFVEGVQAGARAEGGHGGKAGHRLAVGAEAGGADELRQALRQPALLGGLDLLCDGGLVNRRCPGRRRQRQLPPLQEAAHQPQQRFRAAPGLQRHPPFKGRQRQQLAAEDILAGEEGEGVAVRRQRLVEEPPRLKGLLAQGLGAEAVDGHDAGLVHQLQGGGKQLPVPCRVLAGIHQPLHEGVVALAVLEGGMGLAQPLVNAPPEFLGGGYGEGERQNPVHRQGRRQVQAQHQAHIEAGDGVGLAGAGAGFQQLAAH